MFETVSMWLFQGDRIATILNQHGIAKMLLAMAGGLCWACVNYGRGHGGMERNRQGDIGRYDASIGAGYRIGNDAVSSLRCQKCAGHPKCCFR